MIGRVKVRGVRRGTPRPMPAARHAIQPVRVVFLTSLRERAWMVLASVTGAIAAFAFGVGLVVFL